MADIPKVRAGSLTRVTVPFQPDDEQTVTAADVTVFVEPGSGNELIELSPIDAAENTVYVDIQVPIDASDGLWQCVFTCGSPLITKADDDVAFFVEALPFPLPS